MDRSLYNRLFTIVYGVEDVDPQYPGVEDAFADGALCAKMYDIVYDAERRLEDRLGVAGNDADVEEIITAMESIVREIGYKMYCCGAKFGRKE